MKVSREDKRDRWLFRVTNATAAQQKIESGEYLGSPKVNIVPDGGGNTAAIDQITEGIHSRGQTHTFSAVKAQLSSRRP